MILEHRGDPCRVWNGERTLSLLSVSLRIAGKVVVILPVMSLLHLDGTDTAWLLTVWETWQE